MASEKEEDPAYTIGQLRRISAVYETLARMLPTEGRDYNIEFIFKDANAPAALSVRFIPHTRLGKLWCDYCTEALRGGDGGGK